MKHEWKKHEKELYAPGKTPSLITVDKQTFLMISGRGNPNGPDFAQRVGVLYSLAYPIKMRHKADCANSPVRQSACTYEDYTVFPLEGVWDSEGAPKNKSNFIYTIMIRQPDFITREIFQAAVAQVLKKKPHPLLDEVIFGELEDGLCVQMLHEGPFDDEPASFMKMDAFCRQNGLVRISHAHREIYLTDVTKTKPENYRTILRYQVRQA